MDDLDVRSALTEYVTETEPPIGLTREDVLAAGRRSRRRRLSAAGIAGAAFAVVAILGATSVMTTPSQPPPPQPAKPVPGDRCGTRTPGENAQQLLTRLSCTIDVAVRSRVTPGARIDRLTLPGEVPPPDPFLLKARQIEEEGTVSTHYYLDVRVSDDRGAGSVLVRVLPPAYNGERSCEDATIPKTASCSTRRIAEGFLRETTDRNEEGLIFRTILLTMPTGTIYLITSNTGVVESGDGIHLPVERTEPPLTSKQLEEIATMPGLVP